MNFLRSTYSNVKRGLEQFYSPKELWAILFFIAAGAAGLVYRWLDSPARHEVAFLRDSKYIAQELARDSLFALLARRKETRDSFYFYAPDTTEIVKSTRSGSAKSSTLASASISLNRSSEGELMKLPSVGEVTASLILEYRKERGKFRSLTEIMNVRGIGPKKFERMKPYLRLD